MTRRDLSVLVLCVLFPIVAQGQDTATPQPGVAEQEAAPQQPTIAPEVQLAVRKGVQYLEAKEYKEAILAFKAAARRYPTNGQMRYLLGLSYAQDKQLGPAWLHFRQAVRLNPRYEPGVRDFLSMWNEFDRRQILSIGRPKEQIAKFMGEPDRKRGGEQSEVWEYGFMRLQFMQGRLFAVIDPRGMDPSVARPVDVVKIEFDDKSRWRLGFRSINRLQSLTEYVPKGESVQDWKELYSVQRLYGLTTKTTPKKMLAQLQQNLKKTNPNASFQTLLNTDGDVLFHWHDQGGKDQAPQHEIVRLIAGQNDIHRLAYARRVAQIPSEQAQVWLDLLRNATLTKPPKATIPPAGEK